MYLRPQIAVAGRPRAQKQHGIFFLYRVIVKDFAEEAGRIAELRMEFVDDLLAHRVATASDGGTNRSLNVLRPRFEVRLHLSHSFFDDSLRRASPPRVEGSDHALHRIEKQDGHAVC